jgi:hypothetical protein
MKLTPVGLTCFIVVAAVASAAPPTRDAYIAKVDPICKETNRKTERGLRGYGDALDHGRYARAARLLDRTLEIYVKSVRRLGEIEPPAADADRISKWLRLERDDIAVTRQMVSALRRETIDRYNRLVDRSIALERRINRTIGNYGFKHCN